MKVYLASHEKAAVNRFLQVLERRTVDEGIPALFGRDAMLVGGTPTGNRLHTLKDMFGDPHFTRGDILVWFLPWWEDAPKVMKRYGLKHVHGSDRVSIPYWNHTAETEPWLEELKPVKETSPYGEVV